MRAGYYQVNLLFPNELRQNFACLSVPDVRLVWKASQTVSQALHFLLCSAVGFFIDGAKHHRIWRAWSQKCDSRQNVCQMDHAPVSQAEGGDIRQSSL